MTSGTKTARSPRGRRTTNQKAQKIDVYQRVTDTFIAELEKGVVPWRQSWKARPPVSMTTNRPYQGINTMLLTLRTLERNYRSQHWGTYRTISDLGGQVRTGERSSYIVKWNVIERTETDAHGNVRRVTIPFARTYAVFNADQADGLPDRYYTVGEDVDPMEREAAAEECLARYVEQGGPSFRWGTLQPCYSPAADRISCPVAEDFTSPEAFYTTVFHEVAHSTGHASRLNRPGIVEDCRLGDARYSFEELVAEMGAAMILGGLGLELVDVEDSAAYIASWLQRLRADKHMVVRAASQAKKAADLVLGVDHGGNGEVAPSIIAEDHEVEAKDLVSA